MLYANHLKIDEPFPVYLDPQNTYMACTNKLRKLKNLYTKC